MAAEEARRRANYLRATAADVRLDHECFAYAQMFDDLGDWCDEKAAALYDDDAGKPASRSRLLAFAKLTSKER